MGYFLHGLSRGLRRFILRETGRIARAHVLFFDYGHDGGWFIRFIDWAEGPNDPVFIAEDPGRELGKAGLRIDREEPVSVENCNHPVLEPQSSRFLDQID